MKKNFKIIVLIANTLFFFYAIHLFFKIYLNDVIGDDAFIFSDTVFYSLISIIPLLYIEIWRKLDANKNKLTVITNTFFLIVNFVYLLTIIYAVKFLII